MDKIYVVTIDEEFEKSKVKSHTRTRKGKMERVKEFERKGERKGYGVPRRLDDPKLIPGVPSTYRD